MIQVNELITNAFQRISIVGDGMVPEDNQSAAGLADLKSVIIELNAQDLLLDSVISKDVHANGLIDFANIPFFKIVKDTPKTYIGYEDGDIVLVEKTRSVYYIEIDNDGVTHSTPETDDSKIKYIWSFVPKINTVKIPDRIVSLGRKIGNRFQRLLPASQTDLDEEIQQGSPVFYTCETETKHFVNPYTEYEYDFIYFNIHVDTKAFYEYRVNYYEPIANLDLQDTILLSDKYSAVIEAGLCVKLCIRYKLVDSKPLFDSEYRNLKYLIKRTNAQNRPLIYDYITRGNSNGTAQNVLNGYGF